MIDWPAFCVGDGGRHWFDFGMWAANRLVLMWASNLTWFCMGGRYWLDFSVGDKKNLTWFQFRDRKWFVVRLGVVKWIGFSVCIAIDLDFSWWCSTANRWTVLTDRCVCYVLEDHSVTVNWAAQWFVVYKRTKEVRALNSTRSWLSSSVVHLL